MLRHQERVPGVGMLFLGMLLLWAWVPGGFEAWEWRVIPLVICSGNFQNNS